MYYGKIKEEELKNRVARDWFAPYDCTAILGNIDFAVADPTPRDEGKQYYLWAEAKKGSSSLEHSFVQLILTIGQAQTYGKHMPPAYLGAFDAQQIGFIPYNEVLDIFHMNDFDWTVTPSDHSTREHQLLLGRVQSILTEGVLRFRYEEDGDELRRFIKSNLKPSSVTPSKIRIDKNNFVSVYLKWVERVRPSINIDWDRAKRLGILDGDFYLADLLVSEGETMRDQLNVVLKQTIYQMNRRANEFLGMSFDTVEFSDGQATYNAFWTRYERPPRAEYVGWMIERRDLLVPQDVRERKGSYFTPRIWVEKSQEYLQAELGERWQDEYYIWDCAAGTGNLLVGLSNKHRIWASTLDMADVKVMHERIANGANLLPAHVFQFDFLNDDFDDPKVPADLRAILRDPEQRRKLVIYINPPYAEAGNAKQRVHTGVNKGGTSIGNKTYEKYKGIMKQASNELFAQFMMRIYRELPNTVLAEFSTLKTLQGPNFKQFRQEFRAKLGRIFIVPADTFDNVKGQFPIGFKIWHTDQQEVFTDCIIDVYGSHGRLIKRKHIFASDNTPRIGQWLASFRDYKHSSIGMINSGRNDFQNQNLINIQHHIGDNSHALTLTLTNIQISAIFFAVRWCTPKIWDNDRDQFLYPSDGWQTDLEFQSDCLAYTLFHGQNRITHREGINHWIPFTEEEVNAPSLFSSHWMTDYIAGRLRPKAEEGDLFAEADAGQNPPAPLQFSAEAQAVFDAGRELWRYYMAQPKAIADASLYDIRAHFQGFDLKGNKPRMRGYSTDDVYNELMRDLKTKQRVLANKIAVKSEAYEFRLDRDLD